MSISEQLDRLSESSVRRCKYVRFIERLREQDDKPEKVEEFVQLVAEGRISALKAANALYEELGEGIAGDTVAKHLRGGCGCRR